MSRNGFWDCNDDAPISYWPIFPMALVTVPDAFAKVNSVQVPSILWRIGHF